MCLFACGIRLRIRRCTLLAVASYPHSGCPDSYKAPSSVPIREPSSPHLPSLPSSPMSLPVPLITHPCRFCNNPTTLWCSNCHSEYYCCPDHLRFVRSVAYSKSHICYETDLSFFFFHRIGKDIVMRAPHLFHPSPRNWILHRQPPNMLLSCSLATATPRELLMSTACRGKAPQGHANGRL